MIITATKSGDEQNFARFGQFISSAIADAASDLDKDGQVSLLEAYLTACRQVEEYYDAEARLASEHALLDERSAALCQRHRHRLHSTRRAHSAGDG